MAQPPPKRCIICHKSYILAKTIGHWECRMHPGDIVNGRFTCCGVDTGKIISRDTFYEQHQPLYRRGCVPADHTQVFTPYDCARGNEIIPEQHARKLNIPDRAIKPYHDDFVKIWRYDRKLAEEKALKILENRAYIPFGK